MNTSFTSAHLPRLFAALALSAALSGCMSSGNKKARCPVPDGTRCMGLAEVYQRTETSSVPAPDLIDVSTRAGKKQARAERRQAKREAKRERASVKTTSAVTSTPHVTHYAHGHWSWVPAEKGTAGGDATDSASAGDATTTNDAAPMQHQAIPTQAAYIAPAPAPQTDPVRAPAQVMRIVVSAWEDDTGSLHMPSTIFTEIEPRRWKVGSPAIQSSAGFRLFEGLGTQADSAPDTASRPPL